MDRPLFSDMLSERRRELGYSIRQSSRVLRLKEEVLIAFEEGDFEQMPKSGYAQGMLSSYARYLGLDAREVVRAYNEDLEDYMHNVRRQNRGAGGRGSGANDNARVGQPYVAKRGLLPTSGGLAGDMGSFATTRVHTRASEQSYDENGAYSEPAPEERYAPTRPYTGRTPSRQNRNRRTSARSDIRTMDLDEYNDDLGFGRDAQPYESATTSRGRRSSRNLGNTQRPRVNRRSRDNGGQRGSQGRGDRRGSRNGRSSSQPSSLSITPATALVAVVVIIVITVILVVSVGSCVNQNSDLSHSVPVSAKANESATSSSASDTSSSSAKSGNATSSASGQATHAGAAGSSAASSGMMSNAAGSSASKTQDTSVSISVADGAVTWLEVTVDGKSDVAQTVTGPWQRTYTAEKTLSVQAGDTTAVSVVQNGRQMQFESMASGIGTLVIEGSGKSSASASGSSSSTSNSTTSTGNASGNSKSDTAKTGNNSMVSKEEDSTSKTNDYGESYSEYDDSTYYDEYGNAY